MMIVPRLGIGKKSHLPCFKILDFSFGPVSIARVLWSTAKLSLQDLGSEAIVRTDGYTLRLTRRKAALMASEWGLWNKLYVPRDGLVGKTILEVGAGCGESAALLFQKGAKRVVCVEPDSEQVKYLSENVRENGWNAKIIPTEFSVSLLKEEFDLVRMDCEGCEAELLQLDKLPNLIAEVHSRELKRKFLDRGLRVTKRLSENTCVMSNVTE
jgi:SAM-dependent methyltransferase